MVFPTAAAREHVVKIYGAVEGAKQTFERLEEYLATTGERQFVVSRTFDAPRTVVFQAWTDAKQLAQWWGPKGCTIEVAKLELRPGGIFHYSMKPPDGNVMWGRFIYREIQAPKRMVFVNSFSDVNGGLTRAPFSPPWPLEVLNVLTLEEENGKTKLTLRGQPINASEEELRTFAEGFDSMKKGFGGTFDQLAEYLAKA